MFDMVKVEDFMTEKFKWVHDEDSVIDALTFFDDSTDVLLVIDDDNKYSGILTERMILRSGLPRKDTKVDRLKSFAPKVKKSTSIQECARLMLEYDLMNLPVFEDGNLVGVIDDVRLLSSVASKKFGKKLVKDFISEDTIIVTPRDKISGVLRIFRESHISRAPVVDDGIIVGIITLHDIVTKLIHPKKEDSFNFIVDDERSILDYPIEKIMSSPVFTSNLDSNVKDVIDQMIDYNVSSIVIVDDQQRLFGMVTKRDLLEPLSEERKEIIYPFIQVNSRIKNLNRKELTILVENFIGKYREKLGEVSFYVYLREHQEKSKDGSLVYARCRISSPYGRFAVKAEGWGPFSAVSNALIILDKQINKKMSKEMKLLRSAKKQLMNYVDIDSLT